MKKIDDLFNRVEQIGNVGEHFFSYSLSKEFNMGEVFNDFNFYFDIVASEFNISLYNPNDRLVHKYTNLMEVGPNGVNNFDEIVNPQTRRFNKNGTYYLNGELKLIRNVYPEKEFKPDERYVGEKVRVIRTANTRRIKRWQYDALRNDGWLGNLQQVRWWEFWR